MKITTDFLGTVFGVLGAIIIASNVGVNILGFILFIISDLFYIHHSLEVKNKNLLTLNVVFIVINVIGIYRYY